MTTMVSHEITALIMPLLAAEAISSAVHTEHIHAQTRMRPQMLDSMKIRPGFNRAIAVSLHHDSIAPPQAYHFMHRT